MKLHHIHCGACKEKFDTSKELSEHLEECTAAKIGKQMCEDFMDKAMQEILDADPEDIKAKHGEEKPE